MNIHLNILFSVSIQFVTLLLQENMQISPYFPTFFPQLSETQRKLYLYLRLNIIPKVGNTSERNWVGTLQNTLTERRTFIINVIQYLRINKFNEDPKFQAAYGLSGVAQSTVRCTNWFSLFLCFVFFNVFSVLLFESTKCQWIKIDVTCCWKPRSADYAIFLLSFRQIFLLLFF